MNELDWSWVRFEPIHQIYQFGPEFGRADFAVVYKAINKETCQQYAVKSIDKERFRKDQDNILFLEREIKLRSSLNHPNIVKLYDVFEDSEHFYLVTELVKGKELFDKIVERGSYSEKESAHVICQIISAVQYLHENGIVHRDIKPESLLSAGEGENEMVKFADFTFSKSFVEDKLTTSCGSPGYVAPEVLTANSYDQAVDMWAVGVNLYILLSGYPPFYADTSPELFRKIMDVKYDFDDSVWDNISDSAKDLIRQLLVKDPSKRLRPGQCLDHPWLKAMTTNAK
jgi:calcium/calmodulin-dependent protein kinase I